MTSNISSKHKKLSTFQFYFWPVFPEERKLVLLLSSFIFLNWGIISLFYPLHDSLLITAPNSGAEVIGFLRTFVLLPFATLFIIIFTWLHNKFGPKKIVSIFYIFFIIFYIVYSFYIIPNHTLFMANPDKIAHLMKEFPRVKWLFPLYGNWTYSLFYVISILWAGVSSSQLFWQTANHFTQTHQATRLYTLFVVFGGLGSISSASFLYLITFYLGTYGTFFILQIASILNIFLSLLCIILSNKIYNCFRPIASKKEKKNPRTSATEGFWYFFHSSYLFYIFITLVSYGVIYQLINVIWKSELRLFSSTPSSYTHFLTLYGLWGGISVIIIAYMTKTIIHKWGWFPSALVTPLISVISAIFFFSILLVHRLNTGIIFYFHIDSHYLLAIVGSFQSLVMGASGACLFSPIKEMAYIPLNKELKFKGKVTTDLLGTNVGLAASGIIQEGLLSWSEGTNLSIVLYVMLIIAGFFIAWFFATKALGKKYLTLIHAQERKT